MYELKITVEGPVGSGKSIILAKIEQMLKKEFINCNIDSSILDDERRLSDPDTPEPWEVDNINKANIILMEIVK